MIAVASINSFKLLTTRRCLFFSRFFFVILVLSLSAIAISGESKKAVIAVIGTELSFIDSYSPKQIFLGLGYFFDFSIQRHDICFTGFLDSFCVNNN